MSGAAPQLSIDVGLAVRLNGQFARVVSWCEAKGRAGVRIESQAGVFGVRPQNLAVCGHFSLDGDTWAAVLRQLAGEGLGAAFDEVNLRSEEEDEDEDSSSEDSSEDSSVGEIEGDLDTRTRADWEEWVRLEAEGLAATCRRVAGDPEHFEPLPARLMHEAFKGLTGARKRNRERERARWNRRRRRKQEDLQERRREDSLVAHLSGLRIASEVEVRESARTAVWSDGVAIVQLAGEDMSVMPATSGAGSSAASEASSEASHEEISDDEIGDVTLSPFAGLMIQPEGPGAQWLIAQPTHLFTDEQETWTGARTRGARLMLRSVWPIACVNKCFYAAVKQWLAAEEAALRRWLQQNAAAEFGRKFLAVPAIRELMVRNQFLQLSVLDWTARACLHGVRCDRIDPEDESTDESESEGETRVVVEPAAGETRVVVEPAACWFVLDEDRARLCFFAFETEDDCFVEAELSHGSGLQGLIVGALAYEMPHREFATLALDLNARVPSRRRSSLHCVSDPFNSIARVGPRVYDAAVRNPHRIALIGDATSAADPNYDAAHATLRDALHAARYPHVRYPGDGVGLCVSLAGLRRLYLVSLHGYSEQVVSPSFEYEGWPMRNVLSDGVSLAGNFRG